MQQEVIEGYRLSPQQEYLWLLCQQDGAAHRTQCALRLEGELHKSFLKEALQQMVEQYEILRTAFRGMPGMNLPLQVILEHGTWSWREVDLREFGEEEWSSQLAALQRTESERDFHHEQGEVLYACLALLAPARHVLLLNISAMCADSWSLQNLVRELGRRYTARLSGAEVALAAVQYADYSEWQHELLNTQESAGRDFWRQQQVSDMAVLKLPLEKDAGEKYRPAYITLKSDGELVHELEALARANDVSLSELLLATWASLLWRLTGEPEFVVGAAVDGGQYKELHESLGLFTKYLPVPLRLAATSSFPEIIKRVATSYREAYDWQEYYTPGEGHAAEEGLGYEYEEREETVAGYGPLRVEVISEESCRSRQRVLLQCRYQRAAKRLELRLRYDGGCYSPAMIKLLAERLETWLQAVVRAPRAELSKVTLLGEAERELLREWGTGPALERAEACETLGEMLEQQARQQGETAAVVGVDEVLTFSELNARANQLGRYLRARGVGPEAVVGILLERSSRMVECVCGVWKAGGAYLPLHPGTPPARLARVLKQAGVRLVVSERELAGLVAGTGVEVLEWEAVRQAVKAEEASAPEVAVSGANLAYVIYTSGSTGEPKGVMIEQRSVLHLLGGLRQEVYGENDERCVRVGMNAPLSFDASVKQLVQVLRGKTLVVIQEELRLEAGPLLSYLGQRAVDVLDCTPAQLRLLRAEAGAGAQWPGLLLVGGEAIDGELWQQLGNWDETESVNVYGPTEATVDTTWKRISGPSPSIGRPLPQVRLYLLDQHGEQVPIGQVGELYIGGHGIARGYRQAAGLTAARFVPDGYGDERGGRLYRTGDLVRYREDGELEYVGRTDRQVKLRGFRIELEEVEAALLEHEGVKAAAALVRRDDEKEERLVGYVVMRSGAGTRQLAVGEHRLPNGLVIRHQNRSETDYLYEEIFEDQIYLRYGLELPANPCVFDVGANIGMFSLYVSAQSPGARIYAFEPIAEVCESLQHNTELCQGAVKVCRYGLGARSGREEFSYYPQVSARSGLAAYADAADEVEVIKQYLRNREALGEAGMESLAEMAEELLAGVFESRREVCELRSLSEVIRAEGVETIDLLKIDVQRAELDVLKGVAPEDWQKIRQVSMELHDKQGGATEGRIKEIRELLEQSGFEVAVEQDERLRGTDRYNLYARQLRLGGLQRNARKRAAHDGNGAGNGHGPVAVEQGAVGTNIHSLYARRREAEEVAAAELSEVRGANGTSRLWRESVALEAEEAEVSEAELRSYLRERLPEYMVPQVLVKLERMPLSRHGKIDYQRLPAPTPLEAGLEAEAARSEVEALLAGIWSEVLGLVRVGREENFFELGGHSLLATQVMSRVREAFGVEVGLRELFEQPTVKELGQSIERELRQGAGVSAPPIERRERVGELPLSFAQQRLWFIDQLEPGSVVYNVPVAVRLQGSLNQAALAQTLTEVMRRHEVLRTRFGTVGGRAVQVIEAAAPIELAVVELSALEVAEREARVREWAAQEAATPFDLSQGPLLRVQLLRLGEQEHVVLLTMHHIVSDGWSVGVLIKEVGALYAAYVAGEESPLAELPIQYADFALWQRAYLQGEVLDQQLAYWRRQLADAPRLLDLPSDHPRPAVRSFRGAVERFELDQELSEKLRALSQRESVTLFMLLLAAFKLLLLKYTRQADIVIGADVANRNRAETENLIGFFVNMLVLRTDLSSDPTFRELLQRVREVCLEAYAHQDLPFEKLVEEMQPERSLSYAPLFQVVFALQNAPTKDLHLPELTLSTVGAEVGTAKFDLVFNLLESEQRLVGNMEYSMDLFEAATIKRMLGHFQSLLAAVVADPAQQLSRLPLLTEAEEQQLAAWNNTIAEYPREACIHQLFEAQVERTPEAVAVSFKDQQLSYRELNHRANQLAHHLQKLGVAPGAHVGIYLAHSLETLIAILGVLKAGAAYVPIDPEHPLARLNFMIEDAQLAVLLTETGLAERLATINDTRLLCLDSNWEEIASESGQNPSPRATAEDLAYVIYTSGSTGTPKGVKIQHRALVNYIWWAKDTYLQDEKLDFPLYSSLAFDLTVTSIFTPLLTGNRIVVYRPDGWQSPLTEILRDDQVGVLKLTPSHLSLLKDGDHSQSHLKRLIVGGEALESELARQVYESFGRQVEIFNEYGPTEATVGCMIHRFNPAQVELASVPIGRPAANVQIYLLDEQLLPVAEKVIGELYIAGEGLAAGYLNRADLTGESFICNPFRPEQRMYRTKDLARWLPEHEIDYVGRKDEQIKFHGYRVELNELRSVLNGYPGVRDSVVLVRKKPGHGNDRMIAYYAARQEIEPRLLRDFMAQSIIKETIPNVFVHLKKLPLTLNGKVNLKALPDLEESRLATKQIVLAQTPVEEVLVGIWSEVLGLVGVGREENFFELGGHSLLVTQVMSRVRGAFGVEVGLRELFERPTVKELGQSIERELRQGAGVSAPPIERRERVGELPLSFAQQRLWFIDQLEPGAALYNVPAAVKLNGKLDREALQQTLTEVVRRHEVLRTSFENRDGRAVQEIHPAAPMEMPLTDLSQQPEAEREAEVRRLARMEAQQVFDLGRGPLFVVKLLRLSEEEHVVLLTMHHIISDGWSMGLLINEVGTLYKAFLEGNPSPLADLPIQYADYTHWQQEHLSGETLESHLSYWRHQLAGATGLELPPDKRRPAVQTTSGARESFSLPAELSEQLRSLCRREDVTLFMLLLAAFNALLHYYTGQRDLTIGTPIANRNRAETESLIGLFINMLVLRSDLSGDPTFRELLQRAREVCLNAYAHQDVPFEKLVEELQPERSQSRSPLFQIILTLQNAPLGTLELPGLELSAVDSGQETAQYDIALGVRETEQSIGATLAYNSDLYEAATIQRLGQLLQTVLRIITEQPELPLHSLTEMLGEIDKTARLSERKKREESGFAKLKSIRPVPVSVQQEKLVSTGHLSGDEMLPLIVTPAVEDVDLINWAGSNRAYIEKQLARYGAILFRNFKLSTAPEFERFAYAITPNLFQDNGEHPRKSVSGNIYTPTFYPPEQKIIWHNENSFNYQWPTKIWFCCVQPAQQGGETPVVDSRRVFAALPASIKERFIQKGIMYMRNYGRGLGLDWPGVFRTSNKAEIEKHCRAAFLDFEWKSEDRLCTRAVRPAVVKHPVTGEMTWFNQAQHWHISCLDPLTRESMVSLFAEEDLPRNCYYGDGSPIEDSVMNEILSVYQNLEVSFPWQKGDILMLDNLLTAHARNQFVGPRQIMVAMGDMLDYGSVCTTAD